MKFDVTIEIPKGHRNKYEVDHVSGRIRLDRAGDRVTCRRVCGFFLDGPIRFLFCQCPGLRA